MPSQLRISISSWQPAVYRWFETRKFLSAGDSRFFNETEDSLWFVDFLLDIFYVHGGFSWFRSSSCGACSSFARVLRMWRKMAPYQAVSVHTVRSAVFLAPPCLCLRFFFILLIMFNFVSSCNWTRLEQRTSYIAYHVVSRFNGIKWCRDLSCIGVGAYCHTVWNPVIVRRSVFARPSEKGFFTTFRLRWGGRMPDSWSPRFRGGILSGT